MFINNYTDMAEDIEQVNAKKRRKEEIFLNKNRLKWSLKGFKFV